MCLKMDAIVFGDLDGDTLQLVLLIRGVDDKSALFCSVSHMAILFVFTCMMNVGDQTIQAFVTSLGPF